MSRCLSVSSAPPRLVPASLTWLMLIPLVGPSILAAENTASGAAANFSATAIAAPPARTAFGEDPKHSRPPEP
ncbi:MAG: hypothetical protein EOM92_20040, partial [Gammaproteobacteria bacterium]|nr:hypothetical protein [Gammaproteobacteria bacterium]